MANISKSIQENFVHYSIYLIIGFIILSSILSFWNRYVTYDTRRIMDQSKQINQLAVAIETNVLDKIDFGLHQYALSTGEVKMDTYFSAIKSNDSILNRLRAGLLDQNYSLAEFDKIKDLLNHYISDSRILIKTISSQNDSVQIVEINQFLKNHEFKSAYNKFIKELIAFENTIESQAESDYQWSIADNAIIQIILIILSVPILIIASKRLRKEVSTRNDLLSRLDINNRQYLYNDGLEADMNAEHIIQKSIKSFKTAFTFVENVSKGMYSQAHQLIPEEQRKLNTNTLMGALLEMSTKLKMSEEQEKQRQWIANGLNEFSGIVRNNQNELTVLANKTAAFLTRYLESQQGSLFIHEKTEDDEFLALAACYAFEKRKWIDKRIDIGFGLIGQVYLEGSYVMLTDVPNGYTNITSGLGHATPSCLLIVPLIYNEKVEAIFEVAAFKKYETYEIEFLRQAGEFLAAALQSVRSNTKMQVLLRQAQEQAEVLKSQEEELRQNMEELAATNESLSRKQ
jgi:hypothetical protein